MLDPTNIAIDRIKLAVGDTEAPFWLDDSVYEYALNTANYKENAAIKACANYILGVLSKNAHEKLVQIEIYGKEYFDSYKEFLLTVIRNPMSGNSSTIGYGGGVLKQTGSTLVAEGLVNIYKTPMCRRPKYGRGF